MDAILKNIDDLPNSVGSILVVWSSNVRPEVIQMSFTAIKSKFGNEVKISVENIHQLKQSNHPNSTFDIILSGLLTPHTLKHDFDVFEEFLRILRPEGMLIACQPDSDGIGLKSLNSWFKLAGFIDSKPVKLSARDRVVCVRGNKPNFEVGSSVPLPSAVLLKTDINSGPRDIVWKLDSTLDDEFIDPDELLDENDKKHPDPESLRVCGTTGKRKACKDCSCGLAEELASEKSSDQNMPKSSCGSCYLGDAFRCSSCPYKGLPAFKPGEKIELSDIQMKPDI